MCAAECRKYAEKFLDLQRSQFKRIGVFGRFDQPYSTMTPQYEAAVLDILYRFLENDFVYKGLRSVYWCVFDETALAEAEVEYENHTSPTVWVKYPFAGDPASLDAALKGKKVSTIIWTTTPWTLPASMAVAFHPDEEYVALETGDEVYIVGARLAGDGAREDWTAIGARDRPLPRPQAGICRVPASVSGSQRSSACWPITSPWTKAPAWCIPLPRTAPKTSSPARNTRSIPPATWIKRASCATAFRSTKASGCSMPMLRSSNC